MDGLHELWVHLERDLPPAYVERLSPPATGAEIQALQRQLGLVIPEDLKESLSVHNGDQNVPGFVFKNFGQLLSADLIARTYEVQVKGNEYQLGYSSPDVLKVHGPVKRMFWNKAWIPFMGDYALCYAIDLDPTPGGTKGQVILVVPENDEIFWVAESIASLFRRYVSERQQGRQPNPQSWLKSQERNSRPTS